MKRFFLHVLAAVFTLTPAGAWGAADFFQAARPGYLFSFPRDHGAHPEYRSEWWYYSGHLQSTAGEGFGYELTFFRVALKPPSAAASRSAWAAHTVYFAHLALTAPRRQTFLFREKAMRGAMGLAGADVGRLNVWVDDWRAEEAEGEMRLRAGGPDLGLDLRLKPLKPPVLHGEAGYSRKAADAPVASHYYSITRLDTRGAVTLDGQSLDVTGLSWLDREFGSAKMAPDQVGWDWFALQLDDGEDVMLYLMRGPDGLPDPASSGTLVDPQGKARHLTLSDVTVQPTGRWTSPHTKAVYPAGWLLTIPPAGYRLTLTPTLADQELRTGGAARLIYWEGQVQVTGSRGDRPVTGRGYVELTGYAGSLGGRF
ncbi:MAG: carotenoid 1,2-hydratase [Deltaproteobacteria bacterium]|nr:carotenoid 1,2-hydratase [Deltaproteobacteria bacterium]